MEITETKSGQVRILGLRGSLDTNTSKKLHQRWSELIQAGEKQFVLDAAELTFMSSSGLRELLLAAKRLQANRAIAICNLNPNIQKIFMVTGFAKMFPIHNSVDEAVRSMEVSA